jgi:hypothetical protein
MRAELRKLIRFHQGLPGFLNAPLSEGGCRAILEESLRQREANWLKVLRRAVFENGRSPYLPLLRKAGVELGDIEGMVRGEGVEATLSRLAEAGVQVSLDEFKGRVPVRRNGLEYAVSSTDFDNPLLAGEFEVMTGGTTGRRLRLTIDLDLLVFEAAARRLFLESHLLQDRPMAVWRAVPPGSSGIKHVLRAAKIGRPVERWFTPRRSAWDRLQWKSSVFLQVALWHGGRAGRVLPRPEFVPPDEPGVVAEWLAARRGEGRPAVLSCPVSAAVRVAEYCGQHGLDIEGTVMWVGGEPLSEVRQRMIQASGATTVNGWSLSETGTLGIGCAQRSERDEIHLLHSKVAVIAKPDREAAQKGAARLLLTSLLPVSPKLLLNVDSGDHGVLSDRRCGCAIERAGFHRHLHTIRNADKLTAGGMHFTAHDALRLVEEILPGRFGGRASDYQLAEEEREGLGRVALIVSPEVGVVDERQMVEAALAFLGGQSAGHRMMSESWARTGVLEVRRERPAVSDVGKVLPLRVQVRR